MARAAARSAAIRREGRGVRFRSRPPGMLGGRAAGRRSLLAALALATYSASDPVLEDAAVANRAGMAGALVASLLLRGLGYGAFVVVGAAAFVGVRLALGRSLPPLASRFWLAAPLLLIAIGDASAGAPRGLSRRGFPALEGGAVGAFLTRREVWLFGTWGALLLNGVVFAIGCLSATGISTGAALTALGVGLGWLGAGLAAATARLRPDCCELPPRAFAAVSFPWWPVFSTASAPSSSGASSVPDAYVARRRWTPRRRNTRPQRKTRTSPSFRQLRPGGGWGTDPTIIEHKPDPALKKTEQQELFRFDESGTSQSFQLTRPRRDLYEIRRGAECRPREPDHELADPREEAEGLRVSAGQRRHASIPGPSSPCTSSSRRRASRSTRSSGCPTIWRWRCARCRSASSPPCPASRSWASRSRTPSARPSTSATICSSPRSSALASHG